MPKSVSLIRIITRNLHNQNQTRPGASAIILFLFRKGESNDGLLKIRLRTLRHEDLLRRNERHENFWYLTPVSHGMTR